MKTIPNTKYAKSGEVHIAYQVAGDGPRDLIIVPGFVSHLDLQWENQAVSRLVTRLASFSRVISFDKRGTGLSDRVSAMPTLEERMDDVRAVMDAVGSRQATLVGISEGAPMCGLFAATYPQRTTALVMYGGMARTAWSADQLWGRTSETLETLLQVVEATWGTGASVDMYAPSLAHDEHYRKWVAAYERASASPGAVLALLRMNHDIDVRHVLPTIRVPTLILHRSDDRAMKVEHSRYMAAHIAGAKYVELPGQDHSPWVGDGDAIVEEIEEFLTGVRYGPEPDRVLTTVLFTDIVRSTERVAAVGDRAWARLVSEHHARVRHELARFRGREIDTAGDGFFASFDGPARAIQCTRAIRDAVKDLGLQIRAGLHTGECEVVDGKMSGIAVHIGARVAAAAQAGEILVSSTVKDLVAGAGIRFRDRGGTELKGVPDDWRLYVVE